MTEKQMLPTLITQYAESFLEEKFGEKPDRVTVIFRPPFLLLHLSGFLLPGEELLFEKGKSNNVIKTRDIAIHSVKDDLLNGLQQYTGQKLTDLYADWNLSNQSGLLIATLENKGIQDEFPWPQGVDQEMLREIILLNSMRTQRKPDQTNIYWLNSQTLLIERIGILVDIEKQLIRNGAIEELRLAKRPLEHRIIELFNLESLLKSPVQDLYVDWNFQQDVSYMVLLLES